MNELINELVSKIVSDGTIAWAHDPIEKWMSNLMGE